MVYFVKANVLHMVYFVKANVLHMGDDFFKGIFPFVDLTTGGSVVGLAASVERVINEMPQDVLIIPGHGDLATMADLKAFSRMLKISIDTVKKGIEAGKSLADIQAAGLDKSLAAFAKGFIPEKDWIEFTYLSLGDSQTLKTLEGHKKHQRPHHH
jgi:cyclase